MPVEQLDKFIQELVSSPNDKSRKPILQAVGVVLEFYRRALQRLLEVLWQQGQEAFMHRFLNRQGVKHVSSDAREGDGDRGCRKAHRAS